MSKDNTLQQLEYFVKTYGNEVCGLIPIQVIKNAVRDIRIEKERADDLYREYMDMIEHYPHCDGILQKEALHWLNKWKEQVAENERLTEKNNEIFQRYLNVIDKNNDLQNQVDKVEAEKEDLYRSNERLQKQVDELKAENERLILGIDEICKGITEGK